MLPCGTQLWNFCYILAAGDLVILSTGKYRALVVQVQGDYEFVSPDAAPLVGDFQHQRRVLITTIDPNNLWHLAGSQAASGHNIRWAFVKCLHSVDATKAKGEILTITAEEAQVQFRELLNRVVEGEPITITR